MNKIRMDNELPCSVTEWGWKYHHLGIPTEKKMPGEIYLPEFKVFVSGFDTCPFGIEWMRYERGSPISRLVRTVPHLAFEVKDIDHELDIHDFKVITWPESNTEGIRVAMIEYNGAPVELIEFALKK